MKVVDTSSHNKDTPALDTTFATVSAPAPTATSANGGCGAPAEVLPSYKQVSTKGESDASQEVERLKATIAGQYRSPFRLRWLVKTSALTP